MGKNAAIEDRGAEDRDDRLPALAADLIRRRVAVIATTGTPATLAAKAATTVIPIVFSTGANPVAWGLVASLNRPGANLTGIPSLTGELKPKNCNCFASWYPMLPHAARFGFLADPSFPNTPFVIAELQAAAPMLGWAEVKTIASRRGWLHKTRPRRNGLGNWHCQFWLWKHPARLQPSGGIATHACVGEPAPTLPGDRLPRF